MASVSTESVILNDDTWQSVGVKRWTDAHFLNSWDAMTQRSHSVSANEDLTARDSLAKTAATAVSDSFGVDDALEKTVGANPTTEIGLADSEPAKDIGKPVEEQLSATSVPVKQFASESEEAFGLESFGANEIGLNAATQLNVGDDRPVMDVAQGLEESIRADEAAANSIASDIREDALTVSSSTANMPMQDHQSAVGVTDGDLAVNGIQAAHEVSLGVADEEAKFAATEALEDLAIASMVVNGMAKESETVLAVADELLRSAVFIRDFDEDFAAQDQLAKQLTKGLRSSIAIAERMIVPAWMVIADITAKELAAGQAYTHEDFLAAVEKTAMPGWSQWRNFMHGDYEYSKAMFRVVMDSISSDRAFLGECEVAVDVPDVIDRGSARVLEASAETGVYVEFAREYHVIPEINLTARAGVGSNPVAAELMGAPTLLGFTARLRDTITGAAVAGTFTWSSIGY